MMCSTAAPRTHLVRSASKVAPTWSAALPPSRGHQGHVGRRFIAAAVQGSQATPMDFPRDVGDLFGTSTGSRDLGAVRPSHAGRFYQRSLPATQVSFSSEEGRRRFRRALEEGHMENYFFLAEQFRTQDEPTFCGLSTLAMVLNSLRIDPMRTWKGAWRWFNEQNLGCCTGPSRVREEGLNFDMFKCLANCNGADVTAQRAPRSTDGQDALDAFTDTFRATLRATSRSRERECLVICYSRESLGQSGAGHFSPIAGYHEDTDSVLIMDVARFKYPPHWARLTDIAEAMMNVDSQTGRPRGYLHLRVRPQVSKQVLMQRPFHVPEVPRAAGRRLSAALADALKEAQSMWPEPESQPQGTAAGALPRWLHAVSASEPQVLNKLLQVGDVDAVHDVFKRLEKFSTYQDLCAQYATLVKTTDGADLPPLRFSGALDTWPRGGEVGMETCGEFWILLLLLMPGHVRAAVSTELDGSWVSKGVTDAVRGPWALPLYTIRQALSDLVPSAQMGNCSNDGQRRTVRLASE